jgi:Domain of unknown function (DUF5664)
MTPDNLGRKNDEDKAPWELAPWDAFWAILQVIKFGARKYEPRNWERGMAWSRLFSATQRHLTAWWMGEHRDSETGYSHLWHAGCCICFLIAYEIRKVGIDDRPRVQVPSSEDLMPAFVQGVSTLDTASGSTSKEEPPYSTAEGQVQFGPSPSPSPQSSAEEPRPLSLSPLPRSEDQN